MLSRVFCFDDIPKLEARDCGQHYQTQTAEQVWECVLCSVHGVYKDFSLELGGCTFKNKPTAEGS